MHVVLFFRISFITFTIQRLETIPIWWNILHALLRCIFAGVVLLIGLLFLARRLFRYGHHIKAAGVALEL